MYCGTLQLEFSILEPTFSPRLTCPSTLEYMHMYSVSGRVAFTTLHRIYPVLHDCRRSP